MVKKNNAWFMTIIGGIILLVIYSSYYGLPFTATIVSECTQNEPTNITALHTQIDPIGVYEIEPIVNCPTTITGNVYKSVQNRSIYQETIQITTTTSTSSTTSTTSTSSTSTSTTVGTETTTTSTTSTSSSTSSTTIPNFITVTNYKWCNGNSLIINTSISQDIDDYFNSVYTCVQKDKCLNNSECADDKQCSTGLCTALNCTGTFKIQGHSCVTIECLISDTCTKQYQVDSDCNGEMETKTLQGVCDNTNKCSYAAQAQVVECPSYLVIWNKYMIWIIIGAVLLVFGIYALYTKR